MTRRLPVAAVLLLGPCPALAAEEPPAIVVSAPGAIIDGDEAISLNQRDITAGARADLIGALSRNVPGVTLGEAQGNPWQGSIAYHGYGMSALQGSEQGLAVYLDGVRFNQPFGDAVLFDLLPEAALARAELRGPNAVFGRNALGGVLLLTTQDGRSAPGVRLTGSLDSIGGTGATLSLSGAQGATDALLVAEGITDPGWRDASPSRLGRLFAAVGHQRDGWGMSLKLLAASTRLTGNGVAPVELLEADYDGVFTTPDITRTTYARLTAQSWVELSPTTRLEATLAGQTLRRRSVNGDLADFGPCDNDSGLLCVGDDDDFDELLRDSAGAAIAVDPAVGSYAVTNRGRERTEGLATGLQLIDERDLPAGVLRLAAGLTYETARTRFAADASLSKLEADRSVSDFDRPLQSDDGSIAPVDLIARLRDLSAYATVSLPLAAGVTIEGALRWSETRVRLEDRIGTALNGDHRFRKLNPSLELDWELGEAVSLNLGFAQTSRAPTPAELSCADPAAPCALANFFVADPPLRQVTARHWQAGLSGKTGAMSWRAALWRTESDDDIRHVASEVRGRAYFVNGGASRRQGIELAGGWSRAPWRIAASYAVNAARFRSAFSVSSPANPAAIDGVVAVRPGDRLPAIPRHNGSLNLDFEQPGWSIGASLRAQSSQVLAGDEGNDTPPLPGFAVIDLRGHLRVTSQVELRAELRNLFGRRYASFGTFAEVGDIAIAEAPGASDPRAYAPGAPRRLSVSLTVSF